MVLFLEKQFENTSVRMLEKEWASPVSYLCEFGNKHGVLRRM
jgi:hypothetical protein